MSEYHKDHREVILDQIREERFNQVDKWGEQRHAPVWGPSERREHEKAANRWKAVNDSRVAAETGTPWSGILAEEFHEACAESELDAVRAELVQVAAVAVAWIEDIDNAMAEAEEATSQEFNLIERTGSTPADCPATESTCERGCDEDEQCLIEREEEDS